MGKYLLVASAKDEASGGRLMRMRQKAIREMRRRFLAALADPDVRALYDSLVAVRP